jgi:hypothetical protein
MIVMPGLDPGIHRLPIVDCRVMPGNDSENLSHRKGQC